jgi:hypothetical protein
MIPNKSWVGILLVPTLILLLPLAAMQMSDEMAWSPTDFALVWVVLVAAGLTYRLVTRKSLDVAYRAAAGLAIVTALIVVVGNAAVGFIGSENNPANLMYYGVLAVAILGAAIARLQPQGMARALFGTAVAQALVPVIALMISRSEFTPGVAKEFVFNAFFAALFALSGWLFRNSARSAGGPRVASPA